MSEGSKVEIKADDQVVGASELRSMKKRIRELERLLGKKTMEVEILKEAIKVARSRLAERASCAPKARPARYSKEEDDLLLPLIRQIVDGRLTYGYRRVTAVLNRRLAQIGRPRVNHKRVYRIMRLHGLQLTRHTGRRPDLAHDGKVITLKRNLRWSADGFEIACSNAETVRVAFALDCCDREAIGFVASTGGISGLMIRDLMPECVEKRFGASQMPHRVEWLTENGSCLAAK